MTLVCFDDACVREREREDTIVKWLVLRAARRGRRSRNGLFTSALTAETTSRARFDVPKHTFRVETVTGAAVTSHFSFSLIVLTRALLTFVERNLRHS